MPNIDVTEVLLDPDFCETVTVKRIAQSVDVHGRASQTQTTFSMVAVVTAGSLSPMLRAEDYELSKNTITVHSKTLLRAPVAGGQPDIVVWNGNDYVVKKSYNWSHYGAGFTAAECDLQDTVESS